MWSGPRSLERDTCSNAIAATVSRNKSFLVVIKTRSAASPTVRDSLANHTFRPRNTAAYTRHICIHINILYKCRPTPIVCASRPGTAGGIARRFRRRRRRRRSVTRVVGSNYAMDQGTAKTVRDGEKNARFVTPGLLRFCLFFVIFCRHTYTHPNARCRSIVLSSCFIVRRPPPPPPTHKPTPVEPKRTGSKDNPTHLFYWRPKTYDHRRVAALFVK